MGQAPQSSSVGVVDRSDSESSECLNTDCLEANRIVAHNDGDPRSRVFHFLRTQVAREMDANSWRFLAVTSPTRKCKKTATAANLALSLARHPDRSVVLVDLDLSKPRLAISLGLHRNRGLVSTLRGQTVLADVTVPLAFGARRLLALPCEEEISNSSEFLSSRAMAGIFQGLRASHKSSIVIFDLPPLLPNDDALSVLPHMDCVLLVTAIGVTTATELRTCDEYLRSTEVVRIVLNGVPAISSPPS
jgi:Mrp family chromosome partitioning ATPase